MHSAVLMIAGPRPAECAAPSLALGEDFAEFNMCSAEFPWNSALMQILVVSECEIPQPSNHTPIAEGVIISEWSAKVCCQLVCD